MQCSEFQNRLNELLDQRRVASEDFDLNHHARDCPACARSLEVGGYLANLWPAEGTESNAASSPKTSDFGGKWVGLVIAIAASVVVVVGLQFGESNTSTMTDSSTQPSPTIVAQTNLRPLISADNANPPSIDTGTLNSLATMSQPDFVPRADTSAFVHQPLISIGILSRQEWDYPMDEVPIPFGTSLQIEPRWIEVVSNGMAPVQSSVSKTIDAIRRSLSS